MGNPNKLCITTHDAPTNMKEFLKIDCKPTLQLGCVPLIALKLMEHKQTKQQQIVLTVGTKNSSKTGLYTHGCCQTASRSMSGAHRLKGG